MSISESTSENSDILYNYNYKHSYNTSDSYLPIKSQSNLKCIICDVDKNDSFIILSCNHIYHNDCLVETHFKNKIDVIDSEYLHTRECVKCRKIVSLEELMFAHSKYNSKTKIILESHNSKINLLEEKLKNINEELKTCYDYKHKLENDKDKSKNIINNLMILI